MVAGLRHLGFAALCVAAAASHFNPRNFTFSIPQSKIDHMKTLVKLSPLPGPFYEGTQTAENWGVTSRWMRDAKKQWLTTFEWSEYEDYANKYPQYIAAVENQDGRSYDIHYVWIPSSNPRAIPLLLIHGWPGSYVEFFPLIPYLKDFHIVIPSLPGYTFSEDPPTDKEFGFFDVAYLLNKLMINLKYPKYIAQGGDLGAFIGRLLGTKYTANCKGVHFNFIYLASRPELPHVSSLDAFERRGVARGQEFAVNGTAYANMHATRPSTIAHVLSSSPVALLAWIGEKYLEWTDEPPSTEDILGLVSLWWLTQTFPTSIYYYRQIFVGYWPEFWNSLLPGEELHMRTPFGYSYFPKEIVPTPKSWAALTGNMVFFRRHYEGGHFAAFEQPKLLSQDIKAFAKIAWRLRNFNAEEE